jgi:hypothetical protein
VTRLTGAGLPAEPADEHLPEIEKNNPNLFFPSLPSDPGSLWPPLSLSPLSSTFVVVACDSASSVGAAELAEPPGLGSRLPDGVFCFTGGCCCCGWASDAAPLFSLPAHVPRTGPSAAAAVSAAAGFSAGCFPPSSPPGSGWLMARATLLALPIGCCSWLSFFGLFGTLAVIVGSALGDEVGLEMPREGRAGTTISLRRCAFSCSAAGEMRKSTAAEWMGPGD